MEEELLGAGVLQKTSPQDKNLSHIRTMEREKREAFEVWWAMTINVIKVVSRSFTIKAIGLGMVPRSLLPCCFFVMGGQRLTAEYEGLLEDHKATTKKLEASRARSKSLTAEMKTLKVQISTLLEKGKHDDELVDTLLVRN